MAQTIGEQLKEARLQRKLTLEQVSQATHIRVFYLEALENDQRDTLPSAVQGRGFLRLYAGHLGLTIGPLLAAWDGKISPAAPEIVPGSPANVTAEPSSALPVDAQVYEVVPPVLEARPAASVDPASVDGDGSSKAVFREIGQKLRDQRIALGLAIPEVERYTRLRAHYIQALEDGNIDGLPSPVQGRGMLANYAGFLNLNEEALLLRFAEGLQSRRIERLPSPEPPGVFSSKKRPARQAPLWRRFLTPDLIFGIGVAAIILFFALWTVSRITAVQEASVQPTPPDISDILLTPEMTTGTPGTPGAPATLPTGEANGTPNTPDVTQVQPIGTMVVSGANAASNAASTPVGTPTLPPMNDDPLQVYVIARERAWLRMVVDDKVKFLGRTVPGNAYAFSGSKRIELSTGNAAALQVFYNQHDLGTLGITGEVASLVFTTQGYAIPTLAFTFTPTATKLPTITPLPSATPQATPTITPLIP